MNIQKILLIFFIFFPFFLSGAYADEIFQPQCYDYYGKIGPGIMIDDQVYKVVSSRAISKVIQGGKALPFKEYKESIQTHSQLDGDFSILNDDNRKTFTEIDTRETKEFFLELEHATMPQGFHFKMDIDTRFHDVNILISENGEDFNSVSVYNVEDFAFKFFKIQFTSKGEIEEKIKIRELSFKKKSRTYLIKSASNKYIEFYSEYICKENKTPSLFTKDLSFPVNVDTPSLQINLIKNPKFQLFDGVDVDNDWIDDANDNCLGIFNPKQNDSDGNGIGDLCSDDDKDGFLGYYDNCPKIYNPAQTDVNQNGVGDTCEFDKDLDGVPDGIDNCINTANIDQADIDGDNIGDTCDNCKSYNPGQIDANENGIGDVCDAIEETLKNNDKDSDTILDARDNCPIKSNTNQNDLDKDGIGDVCDNCRDIQNPKQEDENNNGTGDICEDIDNDSFISYKDNCPYISNSDQKDSDNDGVGDSCEDDDNDGILFLEDNCPYVSNARQKDRDKDGLGDRCDKKDDRYLETNKNFFMFLLFVIATILSFAIYSLLRKINTK